MVLLVRIVTVLAIRVAAISAVVTEGEIITIVEGVTAGATKVEIMTLAIIKKQ